MEQELRHLYYDPKTGFQSVENLYKKAREHSLDVSRKFVREWLPTQPTSCKPRTRTRCTKKFHVDINSRKRTKKIYETRSRWIWFQNNENNWILTVVEILCRYAFAVPVRRKDTENMTNAVENILDKFHEHFGTTPKLAQFDDGKEFYNVGVKTLLDHNGVHYFSTFYERKASVVEGFNRTLRTMVGNISPRAEKIGGWTS